MRELETSLPEFGEFVLKAQLVKEKAATYCVRWVRRFLTRPASNEPLADQVRRFREELEQSGGCQDWQVIQAEQALRIYFVNFLQRTDWHRRPGSTVVDEHGETGRWRPLNNCGRASEPATTPIALRAATRIGRGASSVTWPSSKARRIRASSRHRFAIT